MKLLDKYLFSQVFWSFLFGLTLVIIVWITPELLPKTIRHITSGEITFINGFLIILYEIPEVIVKSLPMGMLIGSLLVFDKLSKDSEITAMRACGISIVRMLSSILILGLIASIIGFIINETIVPQSSLAQRKLQNNNKLISHHYTYIDNNQNNILKQAILVDSYDGTDINNIKILNFVTNNQKKSTLSEIIAAPKARWLNNRWVLFNGIYYKLSNEGFYEDTYMFKQLPVLSSIRSYKLLNKSLKKPHNMNFIEIKDYISVLLASMHSDEARYFQVTFHQKFSQPFAAIILGIVGLILGLHPPRSSRFLGYTMGMFIILLYYLVWPVSMTLGNIGAINPVVAAWLPNIIAVVIGFVILKYKYF